MDMILLFLTILIAIKFVEGLTDVVEYIKANQEVVEKRYEPGQEEGIYTNKTELIEKDGFSF